MADKNNNNNKDSSYSTESYHHFRLFSYLAMTIVSVAIITNMFLIFQHLSEEDKSKETIANQNTLLENQQYLKNITSNLQIHEFEELQVLKDRQDISANNSKKLDEVLEILKSLR